MRSFQWKAILPALTTALLQSSTFATDWKRPDSGDWHDPNNWTLGIPDSNTDANIDQGTATIESGNAGYKSLQLGKNGSAHIAFSAGSLSGETTDLGYIGGTGTVTMTGGEWNNSGVLSIGSWGDGTLNLLDGILRSGRTVLAHFPDSTGTATFSGGTWINNGDFTVGNGGTGSLTLSGGSLTNNGANFLIGSGEYSRGTVTINSGSITANRLNIGITNVGELNINGGEVENTATSLGLNGGSGTATITAGKWTLSEELNVGYTGTGTINIHGGSIISGYAVLGYASETSKGEVNITDGQWQVNGKLHVGLQGDGALEISGGIVRVADEIVTGYSTEINSTIDLLGNEEKRGALEAVQITNAAGSSNATLSFDGGILRAGADASSFIAGYTPGTLTIESGGAYIDTNGYTIGIDSAFSGEGVLIKQGEGSLTLSAANQHAGGTRIEGGTVIAAHANAFGTGKVDVTEGTLAIGKTISLANTIRLNGGMLAREVGSGQSLANAFTVSSTLGDREIAATILDGTSSEETTLYATFHDDSSALNDTERIAPIFSLSNVAVVEASTGETDLFVLQLSIDNLSHGDYLAWYNPSTNEWVNAVEGNFGGEAQFVGYRGYNEAIDFMPGAYGVDLDNGAVWAVLNHNSAFSIVAIPEPATWAFLALGASLFCIRVRWCITADATLDRVEGTAQIGVKSAFWLRKSSSILISRSVNRP